MRYCSPATTWVADEPPTQPMKAGRPRRWRSRHRRPTATAGRPGQRGELRDGGVEAERRRIGDAEIMDIEAAGGARHRGAESEAARLERDHVDGARARRGFARADRQQRPPEARAGEAHAQRQHHQRDDHADIIELPVLEELMPPMAKGGMPGRPLGPPVIYDQLAREGERDHQQREARHRQVIAAQPEDHAAERQRRERRQHHAQGSAGSAGQPCFTVR